MLKLIFWNKAKAKLKIRHIFKTPKIPPAILLNKPKLAKFATVVKNLANNETPKTTPIKVRIKAQIAIVFGFQENKSERNSAVMKENFMAT